MGGVSQQAPALRHISQSELTENCMLSVVKGNQKRPPTEFVAKLQSGTLGSAMIHTINRDPAERYKVIVTDGGLKVYDIDGVEKTVAFPDGTSYLNAADPRNSFRAMTIADYTFIVNNTIECAMTGDTVASSPHQALIFIKSIAPQSWYRVNVDGTQYESLSDSDHPNAAETAADLYAAIDAAYKFGNMDRSTILLKKSDGSDFSVKADDPSGSGGMYAYKDTVQLFTDLPTIAPQGYFMKVTGATGNPNDIYYVKFSVNTSSQTFDSGVWKETVAEGATYKFDSATMPHVLVRESDGTFTFKKATWTDRGAGDDNTNPLPSFVGNTINDVVFHKGRLGFLSDSNAIFSESGKFFNFWRTTVTQLLDTDPIDVSANQTAILRRAIEFDGDLLIFSDKPQFILAGGDLLTPKSAVVKEVTKFESVASASPTSDGRNAYFAIPKSTYSGVMEYYVDPVSGKPNAEEITSHVPKYLKGTVTKLCASTTENLLLTMSDGDPSTLYPYKYFWNGDQKVQSAWSKWTFNTGIVLDADFINSVAYLVVQRNGGVYLEKMDVSQDRTDSDDVDHLTLLDRRVSEDDCTAVSYSGGRTSWTLPYTPNPAVTHKVVSRFTVDGDIAGIVYDDVQISGNVISVPGDQTAVPVYLGEAYNQKHQFTQFFWYDQKQTELAITNARVQLMFLSLAFEKTGYFKVTVDAHHRDTPDVYEYSARVTDDETDILDMIVLSDGKFRFRIGSDAAECTITVENDSHLPCNLQGAAWQGRVSLRTQQV